LNAPSLRLQSSQTRLPALLTRDISHTHAQFRCCISFQHAVYTAYFPAPHASCRIAFFSFFSAFAVPNTHFGRLNVLRARACGFYSHIRAGCSFRAFRELTLPRHFRVGCRGTRILRAQRLRVSRSTFHAPTASCVSSRPFLRSPPRLNDGDSRTHAFWFELYRTSLRSPFRPTPPVSSLGLRTYPITSAPGWVLVYHSFAMPGHCAPITHQHAHRRSLRTHLPAHLLWHAAHPAPRRFTYPFRLARWTARFTLDTHLVPRHVARALRPVSWTVNLVPHRSATLPVYRLPHGLPHAFAGSTLITFVRLPAFATALHGAFYARLPRDLAGQFRISVPLYLRSH